MKNTVVNSLIKLALNKNNDIDLIKSTGNIECLEYFCESEFSDAQNILVIGAANINNIRKLIKAIPHTSKLIILENEQILISKLLEGLEEDKEDLKGKSWSICRCYWENMRLNPSLIEKYLEHTPISSINGYDEMKKYIELQCVEQPLISEGWADVVYINVMNRFSKEISSQILSQAYILSQKYGKVLVDIVLSDERVTKYIQSPYDGIEYLNIPKEVEAAEMITNHSYHGVCYAWRGEFPIKIVDKVELRSYLIKAYKGKQGICLEKGHAIFYPGPWKEVIDDDGHKLVRGQRMAVCEKTYKVLTGSAYKNEVIGIPPYFMISEAEAPLFDCNIRPIRDPKITKGTKKIEQNGTDSDIIEGSKCC